MKIFFNKKTIRLLKTSFGNVIEWYDFSLYGYFASIIATQFFPKTNHSAALLATFAAFGVGFVARPLGGFIFGYLGDKVGRHFAMNLAIVLMAIPTILMALLPTYDQIGIFAPILLVMVRIIQGISAGGQFSNLLTITTEDDVYKYKGLNIGIAYSVTLIGFGFAVIASFITVAVLPAAWQNFAWRIPFGLTIILLIIQIFLKQHDDEPELNLSKSEEEISPIILLFKHHKKSLLLITLLSIITTCFCYLLITYMVTYTVEIEHLKMKYALEINACALISLSLLVPIFGLVSDFIGRKNSLILSFACFLILSYPLFSLLDHHNFYFVLMSSLGISACISWILGSATPYYTEVFPKNVRASGCSIGFGIGVALGGFAPMVAEMFSEFSTNGFDYFMYSLIIIGLFTIMAIPANTGNNLFKT